MDTVQNCLGIMIPLVETLQVNAGRMRAAAGGDFTNATDLADYLAWRDVSFHDAHRVAGQVVRYCISKGKRLEDLDIEEFRSFSPAFDPGVYEYLAIESCVARRDLPGGPAAGRWPGRSPNFPVGWTTSVVLPGRVRQVMRDE